MLCIPPAINRKLRDAIASGKIDAEKLVKMSSPERDELLSEYLGPQYSKAINNRFMSKFNTDIDQKTVDYITSEMAQINKLRGEFNAKHPTMSVDDYAKLDKAPEWAVRYTNMTENLSDVVNVRNKMSNTEALKHYSKEQWAKIKDSEDFGSAIGNTAKVSFDVLTTPVLKALKTTMDASYTLRQGFKVLAQSRTAYKNSWADSWKALSNVFGDIDKSNVVMREFKARALAHPYYEKLVIDGKLAVGAVEEYFPTNVGEKIPMIGNLFASSNNAFTIFSQSARLNLATEILQKAEANGVKLTSQEIKDIAQVVNSITGRGSLGKFEASSSLLNKAFFAPRYVRSSIDTFLMPMNPTLSKVAKAEALKNSRNTLGGILAIMSTASMFTDVNWDPFSTGFGTMKVPGSTARVDLTAGHGQYIVLAAREAWGKKTDSKGKTVTLGDTKAYKPETRTSIAGDFAANKLSPSLSYLKRALSDHELYGGKEINLSNSLRELVAPITPDNAVDYLQNEDIASALIMIAGDMLGAGVRTKY